MPYVDIGQSSHRIGHCNRCKGKWVIAPGTVGITGNRNNTYDGKVCPFCKSSSVTYTRESNR